MLAPPPTLFESGATIDEGLNTPSSVYYSTRRGSSLSPRQVSTLNQHQQVARLRSASCIGDNLPLLREPRNKIAKCNNAILSSTKNHSAGKDGPSAGQGQRRPSRAYLLRQKSTGEETVVTVMPIHGNKCSTK